MFPSLSCCQGLGASRWNMIKSDGSHFWPCPTKCASYIFFSMLFPSSRQLGRKWYNQGNSGKAPGGSRVRQELGSRKTEAWGEAGLYRASEISAQCFLGLKRVWKWSERGKSKPEKRSEYNIQKESSLLCLVHYFARVGTVRVPAALSLRLLD